MNTWKELVSRQTDAVNQHASVKWINGMRYMENPILRGEDTPSIEDLHIPHWRVQGVLGKSPEKPFWYRLSRGIFNVNLRLRSAEQIDYLEERDTFHDVWGHLPILWDKQYTDYIIGLGVFAQHMRDTPEAHRALSNAYWFTSEFGLVMEHGELKVYGAGILSSKAEMEYAMSDDSPKRVLDITSIWDLFEEPDYVTDGFQHKYYVLPDWDTLNLILRVLWKHFSK